MDVEVLLLLRFSSPGFSRAFSLINPRLAREKSLKL